MKRPISRHEVFWYLSLRVGWPSKLWFVNIRDEPLSDFFSYKEIENGMLW
jgi:hypothetical protein